MDELDDHSSHHERCEGNPSYEQAHSDIPKRPAQAEVPDPAASTRQNVAEQKQAGDFLKKATQPSHFGDLGKSSGTLNQQIKAVEERCSAGNEKYEEEFEPTPTHFDRRDLNLHCLRCGIQRARGRLHSRLIPYLRSNRVDENFSRGEKVTGLKIGD
jgi:hypothetical protein